MKIVLLELRKSLASKTVIVSLAFPLIMAFIVVGADLSMKLNEPADRWSASDSIEFTFGVWSFFFPFLVGLLAYEGWNSERAQSALKLYLSQPVLRCNIVFAKAAVVFINVLIALLTLGVSVAIGLALTELPNRPSMLTLVEMSTTFAVLSSPFVLICVIVCFYNKGLIAGILVAISALTADMIFRSKEFWMVNPFSYSLVGLGNGSILPASIAAAVATVIVAIIIVVLTEKTDLPV